MRRFFLSALLLTVVLAVYADTLTVTQWWVSSPVVVPKPFFHDTKNVNNDVFSDENLLMYPHHEIGKALPSDPSSALQWSKIESDTNPLNNVTFGDTQPEVTYCLFYVETLRWAKVKIEVTSPQMIRVWCNGNEVGSKKKADKDATKPGNVSKELKLLQGKHLVAVKHVRLAGDTITPMISARIITGENIPEGEVSVSFSPQRNKQITDILDGTKARRATLSFDGSYYALTYSSTPAGGKNVTTWTEICRSSDNLPVYRIDHRTASNFQWLPNSNRFSYMTKVGEVHHLEVLNVDDLSVKRIFAEDRKISSYRWLPDESGIVYSVTEESKDKYETTRRIDGMQDRQPGFRDRDFLHILHIPTGTKKQLTYGNQTTYLMDISPDGRWIAVGVTYPDYQERPFSKQTAYLLNIQTLEVDTLWKDKRWGVSVSFSPDGKKLLCSGGPSSFGKIGENIGKARYANNYDKQLYIFDIKTKQVEPITLRFDPSVESAEWSPVDNSIYLIATNKDTRTLFRYNPERKDFVQLTDNEKYINGFSLAAKALKCAYQVSKINRYGVFVLRDLTLAEEVEIEETEKQNYRDVVFGDTKDWNFKTKSGKEIEGRVYYPANFDPTKKYPVIVYYYGGTTPVGRIFGGRYPFNLWAGAGYLVYVLQPSGAIGFGQEFSAAHVNNWGKTVADEIIEGTQKFLAAHPFANAKKVGCIGASYGGFMTMYLLTRTDIFAAAVSHAGISSISSYWGEGYWGYAYSAEASADSYPWNNPELYVNQSPLFRADKVKTPLLLLTGDKDTNVPPGESIQMYTALKILGRPVELVTVKDEDHHINGYQNRIAWHNTIMAWWDKNLKDCPEWWEELYPAKNY